MLQYNNKWVVSAFLTSKCNPCLKIWIFKIKMENWFNGRTFAIFLLHFVIESINLIKVNIYLFHYKDK